MIMRVMLQIGLVIKDGDVNFKMSDSEIKKGFMITWKLWKKF